MDAVLAERDEARKRYREAFLRARNKQAMPTNPVAIAKNIDPFEEPWKWLSSVYGGRLVRPVPPEHPCPGCYLYPADEIRLMTALLKHIDVADMMLTFGFNTYGEVNHEIELQSNKKGIWSRPPRAVEPEIDDYVKESVYSKDMSRIDKTPLRVSADAIYNILSSVPRSIVVILLAQAYSRKDYHQIAVICSLSPHISYPPRSGAGGNLPTLQTVQTTRGRDAGRMVYMLPVDSNGSFFSGAEVGAIVGQGRGAKETTGLREAYHRHAEIGMRSMRSFANILCNVKYVPRRDATILSTNAAGVTLVGMPAARAAAAVCSLLSRKESMGESSRGVGAGMFGAPVKMKPGMIGGYCTTVTSFSTALMIASGTAAVNIGEGMLSRMSKESGIAVDDILGRVSFNIRRMFGTASMRCCSATSDYNPKYSYTIGGTLTEPLPEIRLSSFLTWADKPKKQYSFPPTPEEMKEAAEEALAREKSSKEDPDTSVPAVDEHTRKPYTEEERLIMQQAFVPEGFCKTLAGKQVPVGSPEAAEVDERLRLWREDTGEIR